MSRKLTLVLIVLLVSALAVPMVGAGDDNEFYLTILHTNDQHSHHDPVRGNGGAARELTVVNMIREETDNVLLLDAGDRFTGTLFHTFYRGEDNAQVMNLLGYDAMAVGNHEFDDGPATLANFIGLVDFPVVSANIDASNDPDLAGLIEPWVILEVGGEQIGIIGLTTPGTVYMSSPGENVTFDEDLVGVLEDAVAALEEQGVNKIILLSHCGYEVDLDLAASVDGIDIIVGGHTHTLLSNLYSRAEGPYPTMVDSPSGDPVAVVQAGQYNIYLGRLDARFDENGVLTRARGDVILLVPYIAPDPDMSDLLDELRAPLEEMAARVVGETEVELSNETCRAEECVLGNLIADAIREETGVQVALQNGGGIRATIPAGEVTYGQILEVLPFGNTVSTFELSGEDLLAALENGVSRVGADSGTGRFLQVSGLRFSWDGSQEPGSRIVSAEVWNEETGEWEPVDPEAIYTVACNDFMRRGGDEYYMLRDNAIDPYDFGRPLDEVVMDYIAAHSPVAPELEGRITRVDAE